MKLKYVSSLLKAHITHTDIRCLFCIPLYLLHLKAETCGKKCRDGVVIILAALHNKLTLIFDFGPAENLTVRGFN